MLDPYVDEPAEHLGWRGPDIIGKTDRGKATIRVVRLDRVALIEARQETLTRVKLLLDSLDVLLERAPDDPLVDRLKSELGRAIGPAGPYAACVRDRFGSKVRALGIRGEAR